MRPEQRFRRNLHLKRSQNIRRAVAGIRVVYRYDLGMAGISGKVHVVRVTKTGYVDKQGRRKDYSSAYLRRTYRDGGKVKNETVANLSALPDHVIDLIDAGLKGQQLVPAASAGTITRSLPHGHAAAAQPMAPKPALPPL